jgi:DNA-binding NarL/FixJ family response regulator
MALKIFVVEDHAELRQVYGLYLQREGDMQVCGMTETAEEALERIPGVTPDVVVVDLSLPKMSGIELIRLLNQQQPELAILVVSGHSDLYYANEAFKVGARGFVDKKEAPLVMADAIRRVAQGEQYLSERMRKKADGYSLSNKGSYLEKT